MAWCSGVLDPRCDLSPQLPGFLSDPFQVTLQARLYALYHLSKKILVLMVFGYVCEIAAVLTILGFLEADARGMSFSDPFYPSPLTN